MIPPVAASPGGRRIHFEEESMYPSDYLYSRDHEWVHVEGDLCTLGITEYAQEELGEIVFVELPDVGQSFNVTDEVGTIESVKAVAEVYTPVSGDVAEVNSALEEEPELVNDDPHGDGWLIKLRIAAKTDLDELMSAEQYEEYLQSVEG
ncbi:MAG TPA: glycine cleavage system protein GcvH [Thermoanaerobaculia bacterium]|jgi:glycine cleavage system H protein|nr:glycine cleavage system protein GcvH [Thermoanaerobaculia bacterium]